ncbi:hypothetical protein ACHAWF_000496, partial [Thalassiosira exigua]
KSKGGARGGNIRRAASNVRKEGRSAFEYGGTETNILARLGSIFVAGELSLRDATRRRRSNKASQVLRLPTTNNAAGMGEVVSAICD